MFKESLNKKISPSTIYLFVLFLASFIYRAYPHLMLIPKWIVEEESFAYNIFRYIISGLYIDFGYRMEVEHVLVYFIYIITHINIVILIQYINPIIGALTIFPIYILLKQNLDKNKAILGTTLWTFSETAIYRTSTFSSSEPLGLFIALFALIAYQRKKYIIMIPLLIISFYTHLLPSVFVIVVISLNIFLNGTRKQQTITILGVLGIIAILFSPLNPNQSVAYSINPIHIISQFNISNIFIYSPIELISGASIFGGSIILLVLSIISIILNKPKNTLMYSYLICCFFVFIFSWIFYSPLIISPPRTMFLFIVPFVYFSTMLISKLSITKQSIMTIIIIFIMIISSFYGADTMLFIKDSATLDEYKFTSDFIKEYGIQNSTKLWWGDYTAINMIASSYLENSPVNYVQIPITNMDTIIKLSEEHLDPSYTMPTFKVITDSSGHNVTEIIKPMFTYVYLSPRMESSGLFMLYTNTRTIQIRKPVVDIWANSPYWMLLKEENGIKVYKWIETS